MNDSTAHPDDLQELLIGVIDGKATTEQINRLSDVLCDDPAARRRYLLHMMIHARLQKKQLAAPLPVSGLQEHAASNPSPFIVTLPDASGFLSSGWPMAYLVATVISGIALVIGSLTPVSQPVQVASQSSTPSRMDAEPKIEPVVGRITGMVDCQWEGSGFRVQGSDTAVSKSPDLQTSQFLVSLGDKFALHSGLMEITYNTGARVILQGPVTYEVESNGGYLSLGKLTGKLETKAQDPRPKTADPSSLILHPSSFVIRTPTAIVTDLGTEFGVEVSEKGDTSSHIFRGMVSVQLIASGREQGQVIRLGENESVRIDKRGKVVRQPMVDAVAFVRVLSPFVDGKEIPVSNADFESPALAEGHGLPANYGGWYNDVADSPAGWRKIGLAGVLAGGNAPIPYYRWRQWGFCNVRPAKSGFAPSALYQAVAPIDPAVDYTLTADTAVQRHIESADYKLSLWAGPRNEPVVELASVTGTATVYPKRVQVTSRAIRHAQYAGQDLFVRFENAGTWQVLVDHVHVTASPSAPDAGRR